MNKYILATGTIAALLTASPVFADTHGGHGGFGLFNRLSGDSHIGVSTDANAGSDGHNGIGAQVNVLAHNNASTSGGIGSIVSMLAHRFHGDDQNGNDNDWDDHQGTSTPTTTPSMVSVNLVGTVSAVNGTTITLSGKNGATYSVNAASTTISGGGQARTLADIKVGDTLAIHGTLSGSTVTASAIVDKSYAKHVLSSIDSLRAGIVTAVSGTGLTLQPFGAQSTTSISTNSSTTVYMKGGATTTGAIATGTNVLAFGTTSTSTPNTFVASVIVVLGQGLLYLKDLFLFR